MNKTKTITLPYKPYRYAVSQDVARLIQAAQMPKCILEYQRALYQAELKEMAEKLDALFLGVPYNAKRPTKSAKSPTANRRNCARAASAAKRVPKRKAVRVSNRGAKKR